jgi:UDP-2,3-diacylglucosamine pyrophosphatase LpxH
MTKYNSVFISDLHLGSKHCQSDKLLEFIKTLETNNLFLVGDIIDGWRLSKKWYWPKEHSKIIKEILKKDIPVTYIPGNHDEFLRSFGKFEAGNIKLLNQCSYTAINGEKYLVTHGDIFDYLMRSNMWPYPYAKHKKFEQYNLHEYW